MRKDSNGELGLLALCAIGGLVGGLVDYAGQVLENYRSGECGSTMWTDVNWGSVASSTFSGVVSAIPGGGGLAAVVDVIGSAAIEQGVNCLIDRFDNDPNTNRAWSNQQFAIDVTGNIATSVCSAMLPIDDVPRYLRDIKAEARAAGIKGTKNLTTFLNFKQVSTIVTNTFYNDTVERLSPI